MLKNDKFFDDSIFEDEPNQDVNEVENIDLEEEYIEGEASTDEAIEGKPSEEYIELGYIFIGMFDETRALLCSLISGEDKDTYLFYKKNGKLSKDNEMVIAAAKVAQKYNLSFGVEFLLIAGLIASSIYIVKKANDDRKAKKDNKNNEKKATEKPI